MNAPLDPNRPQLGGPLCEYLADLAEEVQPVDLRDRVRASSRRLAVRRTGLATAALAAVVAVASGVAWAGLPRVDGPGKDPVGDGSTAPPTAVVTSPPPTMTPTPTGPADFDRPVWDGIPGTLYYLTFDGTYHHLQALTNGKVREILSPRTPACGLAVSPDRTRVAWTTTDGGGSTGDLVVARIDGSGKRTVLRNVACTGGNVPFWLPDSRHMLLARGNQAPRQLVNVDTAALRDTPLASVLEYVAWSPNGRYVAYEVDGKIVVARPDGTVVSRVKHGKETPTGGFSVQGVSDDGHRVVVGVRGTDPDQIRSGFRLVDAGNGQNIALPAGVAPTDPMQARVYPLAGGQLLVRVTRGSSITLYLIADGGQVRAHRVEPAALSSATLLFTPTP